MIEWYNVPLTWEMPRFDSGWGHFDKGYITSLEFRTVYIENSLFVRMRREITKSEFVSNLLKDDLDSRKKPELEKHRKMIENPNLLSEEENKLRLGLVKHNGAFGMLFEYYPNMSFYAEEINRDEFLELQWCPNGSPKEDGIDIVTSKTRYLRDILKYLKAKYSNIEYDFYDEEVRAENAKSISELTIAEARIARQYWTQLAKIIPEKLEFDGRKTVNRPFGAGDYVNCMLNYGYAILESECLRAINASGLDVHVGFLHEMTIGKNSLAYDLQEPFRFLIDLAVISAIEKDKLTNKDFIRTENYNLRLKSSGAKKIMEEINIWFNKKVKFKGQVCSWSYVLMSQTTDLAHYLLGNKSKINFAKPEFELEREDTKEIRNLILNISYKKWKDLGFSKGTLHPMKQKAKENKPFYLTENLKKRLMNEKIINKITK